MKEVKVKAYKFSDSTSTVPKSCTSSPNFMEVVGPTFFTSVEGKLVFGFVVGFVLTLVAFC